MEFWNLVARPPGDGERGQVARYLLTGSVAWLVDIGVFYLCLASVGVIPAQVAARLTGAAVAFAGHKLIAFRAFDYRAAVVVSEGVRYAGLWLLSFGISTVALVGLIEHASWNPLAAKIIVEAGIVAFNYLLMRSLIFRHETLSGLNE